MANFSVQLSNNGLYVCAENSGGDLLVVNRTVPLQWETFILIDTDTQATVLQSGSSVGIQCSNGQFVCAENGGGSNVIANRYGVSAWETFTIIKVGGVGGGSIQTGDSVVFLCSDGVHYLCAEGGGGQQVVANRTAIGPWETFVITGLPSAPVTNLDARVDSYRQQVGLSTTSQLGQEKWFNACEIAAQQGAGTFNSGREETCTWQHNIPGWQILEYNLEVLENKNGRGSYSADIIAKDGQFTANEQEIGDKWKGAIDLSIKAGDLEATRKLELEYQRNQQLIRNYAASKNTFFLKVNANGGLFEESIIRVKGSVRAIQVS